MPTYSYTMGGTSTVDKMRMLIPDRPDITQTPQAMFSDEELGGIYDLWSDIFLAAAEACAIVATDKARQAISWSLNSGISINKANIPSWYFKRAEMLRTQAGKIPFEAIDSVAYEVTDMGEDEGDYIGDE